MNKTKKSRVAFTLIEVIITMVIIAILLTMSTPVLSAYYKNAKMVKLQNDFNAVHKAIEHALMDYDAPIPYSSEYFMVNGQNIVNAGSGWATAASNNSYQSNLENNLNNLTSMFDRISTFIDNGFYIKVPSGQWASHTSILDLNFVEFSETREMDSAAIGFSGGFFYYSEPVILDERQYLLRYDWKDNDPNSFTVSFIYNESSNEIQHIILYNEGYYTVNGGELNQFTKSPNY